jgi:hypothetical protein
MNIGRSNIKNSFSKIFVLILLSGIVLSIDCAPEREISLFNGKTLGHWEVSDFIQHGDVYVKDGAIYIEKGGLMSGIHWTGPLVRMNYVITLEAMPVEGSDFFCGLTFPVGDRPCSLILGGWGGTLCGLSSLNYLDASQNETTTFVDFNLNQWYRLRLRVTENRIQAWLDDEILVDVDTTKKYIDIRIEVEPSLPLGIATYLTTGAIRNIKLIKMDE